MMEKLLFIVMSTNTQETRIEQQRYLEKKQKLHGERYTVL